MHSLVGPRLSIMMFLQFFIWGAWWVTLGPYMGQEDVAMSTIIWLAYLSQPIGAMISPFFLGMVADRFFASERVLALLHLLGAILLACVPFFSEMEAGQTIAMPFLGETEIGRTLFIAFIILHMLCYMPTIGLTNTVAFNTMTDPENQFPLIRVWGTIGWILSGLVVGVLFAWILGRGGESVLPEHTTWPFFLGAGAALVMAVYSLTLPHTPPPLKGRKASVREILGLDAVSQLSSRSFWSFIVSSMLICIPLATYYTYAAEFATEAGMQRELPLVGWTVSTTGWMSTGQMTEVLFMLLMPLGFARLGVKWMLLVGMGAWVLRYGLFALGAPEEIFWMIWLGILLHGVCYDFFFVTGMIYVEKKSPPAIRAQAQGFLVQMTLGVGMFIGMLLMGRLYNEIVVAATGGVLQAYRTFWLIPAALAAVVMVFFGLTFYDRVSAADVEETEVAGAATEEGAV